MLIENAVLAKFDSAVKSFSQNDRIAVCHDLDADGISSGVIAFNAIKILRGKEPELVITQRFKTVDLLPQTLDTLKKEGITKLIVVDFAVDQKPASLKEAQKIVEKVIVIDHHKNYNYSHGSSTLMGLVKPDSADKVFIIKPQFVSDIEPSRYPCAKFCFDLFSRHVGLEKISWVACIGLMGDNQYEQWKDFVDSEAKKHKSNFKEIWRATEVISAVEVLAPEKLGGLFRFIANAKGPKQLVRSKYASYLKKLDSCIRRLMEEFGKNKEIHDGLGLIWFEFNTKSNIKSALINKVSNGLYPDKTLLFVQKKGDGFVSFSCRRQDFKIKTNELLENAVKGFENAGAGGHVPASAGRIMEKDLPEFKRRVFELLKNAKK